MSKVLDAIRNAQQGTPILARILSLWTAITSIHLLLRVIGILPQTHSSIAALANGPGHVHLLSALQIAEPIILLIGAALLWLMKPLSAIFFLLELIASTSAATYLTYISPDAHMLTLRSTYPVGIVFFLGFAFNAIQFGYVWWVTSCNNRGYSGKLA